MTVRYALLALLLHGPASSHELRRRFDALTGEVWPLNIGQVSTTMQRLQRDGHVEREGTGSEPGAPWRLTSAGQEFVGAWWKSPVVREPRGRDELVVKLVLAMSTPGIDVLALIRQQRRSLERHLDDLSGLRENTSDRDLPGRMVLDHHTFVTEAEIRWLSAVEAWPRIFSDDAGRSPSPE